MRRDARLEHLGVDLGEESELARGGEAGGVDGNQNVGRTAGAFVLQALEEFLFLAFDAVDADAGFLGEAGVQRFVGLVVAGGVEVEDLVFCLGAGQSADREDNGWDEVFQGGVHEWGFLCVLLDENSSQSHLIVIFCLCK